VLLGRAEESAVIDQLLANARSGSSGTIVIKGEAGIGKSTLLDYAAHHASGMRVLRISGVESEAEIAFGALHLLLHEHLALIDSLPDVQAAALRAALGEAPARAEDRLLIGLALLTLLSDLAEQMPLAVLLDDAQWFDQPSTSALSFAARRLAHEGIVMIFAVRDGERGYAGDGLPELQLARLDDADAARFLNARLDRLRHPHMFLTGSSEPRHELAGCPGTCRRKHEREGPVHDHIGGIIGPQWLPSLGSTGSPPVDLSQTRTLDSRRGGCRRSVLLAYRGISRFGGNVNQRRRLRRRRRLAAALGGPDRLLRGHPCVEYNDRSAIQRRRADQYGAALRQCQRSGHWNGADSLGPGPHELPRYRRRQHDQGHCRCDREDVSGHGGRE
jgi:hypothetical protein